jgi:maleate isomerase
METWKSKIGLIYLSSSTVMEREWSLMSDGSFSFHVARISLSEGSATREALYEMVASPQLEMASKQLADADVDLICFGCTVGSLIGGVKWDQEIIKRIEKASRIQATTTSTEVVRSLTELRAKVISIATPYLDELNRLEKDFFEAHDFKVAAIKGLRLERDRDIGRQSPEAVASLAREVFTSETDCIFISCTNFRTFEIIEPLEREFDVPIISSIQASLWGSLRQLGLKCVPGGVGSLMKS